MFGFIKHWLTPHEKNNHRAKILHNSSLTVFVAIFLLASLFIHVVKSTSPAVLGISYSISEGDLINLVNSQRQSNGLAALSENSALDDAARRKAADMFAKNYWAHFSPDGSSSPWNFIKDSGYSYSFAGENLAKGFTDAPSVVSAWMNSSSHRENILSGNYRDVGFAIVPGTLQGEETVLVVQMFGTRASDTLAAVSSTTTQAQSEALPTATPAPLATQAPVLVRTQESLEIPTVAPTVVPLQSTPSATIIKPKVDAQITSKAASTVGLSFLAFALAMDLLIVERRKIPRVVGHNLDHIILILLFILFMLLKSSGVII